MHDALKRTGAPYHRIYAFETCGSSWWVLASTTRPGVYKLIRDYCHDRWCSPCAALRSDTIAGNLLAALHGRSARLLTLTIRGRDERLADLLRRLLTSFRRLRRLPLWRQRVEGGVAVLEVTRNPDTAAWHPHLHCLITGKFIPQDQLADEWERCTGDSRVVDIRWVSDRNAATKYVTKYLTKPIEHDVIRYPPALDEAVTALRGTKQLYTFGKWRRLRLTKPLTEDDWRCVGHWHELETADSLLQPERADLYRRIAANPRRAITGEWTLVDLELHDTS